MERYIQAQHTWTIAKFASLPTGTDKNIKAPVFDLLGNRWAVLVHPDGDDEDCRGYVSMFLANRSKNYVRCVHRVEMIKAGLVVSTGNHFPLDPKHMDTHAPRGTPSSVMAPAWGRKKWAERAKVLDALDREDLCLRLTVVRHKDDVHQIGKMDSLRTHLHGLLDSPLHTDVTLNLAEGQSIRAHRCILAARSSYFAAMFAHPMVESTTGGVQLDSISFPMAQQIVRYLYTGCCDLGLVDPPSPRDSSATVTTAVEPKLVCCRCGRCLLMIGLDTDGIDHSGPRG